MANTANLTQGITTAADYAEGPKTSQLVEQVEDAVGLAAQEVADHWDEGPKTKEGAEDVYAQFEEMEAEYYGVYPRHIPVFKLRFLSAYKDMDGVGLESLKDWPDDDRQHLIDVDVSLAIDQVFRDMVGSRLGDEFYRMCQIMEGIIDA